MIIIWLLFIATVAVTVGAIGAGALVKRLWVAKYLELKKDLRYAEMERDSCRTWFLLTQRGISIREYFSAHGYDRIGVLGMEWLGRRTVDELGETVICAVEADNFAAVHERLTVWRLGDDPLPEVDVILVTDLKRIPEKIKMIRNEFSGSVVTLTEVLTWLLQEHGIEPRHGAIANWPPKELLSDHRTE